MTKPIKPLGGKAYGSIPHLPGSRLGPGDHHCHQGQSDICLVKPRRGDRIIVTEKLDGACMAVAKINGAIVPLTRAGYHAAAGTFPHLRAFSPWVERYAMFDDMLAEGERICGEWLALAHGTKYDATHPRFEPFVAFDLIRGGERVLADEFRETAHFYGLPVTHVLHDGTAPFSIESAMTAMTALGEFGHHGAIETPEGAVWRVEREGRVDFLAKYVRPDKQDGKYLPQISGAEHWHFGGSA